MNNLYNIYIYERYKSLKDSDKKEYDNNDLWKIFEYFSCIKLTDEYKKQFYEYDDISPDFKEENRMSRRDTGIDACDLIDTIVQCKLRKDYLNWKDCSTFFGSQNIYDKELKKAIVRWPNLIITRNKESILSEHLLEREELFIDKTYTRNDIISYCENLIINPPKYPEIEEQTLTLRDYQTEAIDFIKNNKQNIVICLPTGTGKNVVIINSLLKDKKYLILVPRIFLMEQFKEELLKNRPYFKHKIQYIGDNHTEYKDDKLITICVYNSISLLEEHMESFEKIFVDEAHHINMPEIYKLDNDEYIEEITEDDEDEENDDEELEEVDAPEENDIEINSSYIKIIKSFSKYKNNVYLSATIDEIDGFLYYKKDIRDMIDNGYLCDYTIHIPIFTDDPTNRNICEYVLKYYRNVIIYCNSQKEGKHINKLINSIQSNSCEYIDCNTSRKKRNDIINKYKNGLIPYLVNVRILIEGFDAPITKGVVFLHMPKSQTTLIQIIGRSLRLHNLKNIANIILPYSNKEDEKNISTFLKVVARNDKRIRKSYENKKLGGYIAFDTDYIEEENDEIELKYEMIYNSFGKLLNGNEIWEKKLEEVKKYIDDNGCRPYYKNKDINIKKLGKWIHNQCKYYKNKIYIMKNDIYYNKWKYFINDDKYKKYFLSNEENWYNKLELVKQYIDINNKTPSHGNKDINIRILGSWISMQRQKYKKVIEIMANENIRKSWETFINNDKYKKYFLSNEEIWYEKFEMVKHYMNTNNKRPSCMDKDINIKQLGAFIQNQLNNYKNIINVMADENIKNTWETFINDNKYKKYFLSNDEIWYEKFELVKKYMNINNKRPSEVDKDINIKQLGQWFSDQQKHYKKNKIVNEKIRISWETFINDNDYKKYFLSNEEYWYNSFELVKQYININNKRPSCMDKDINIKQLGQWLIKQQKNYNNKEHIMANENIRKSWEIFITDEIYKEHFLSNEENWYNKLTTLKEYINNNSKRPTENKQNDYITIELSRWVNTQIDNYKYKKNIMQNQEIYNAWTTFINNPLYKNYFISNEEEWCNKLEEIKLYININNKKPSYQDKDINIKKQSAWLSRQITNYKNKRKIMQEQEIYDAWTAFINDPLYKKYFD
jgi:superfamily II DNA or RNA helicase